MPEGSWVKAAYEAVASGADRRRRAAAVASTVVLMCAALAGFGRPAPAGASFPPSFRIPASARELIVVSSPTYDPPGYLASFRSYARTGPAAPWKPVFATWQAETGRGHLLAVRREGDGATPVGVFAFGPTIYGNSPDPGGVHEAYHRLVCGDWWDEDRYSSRYNRFVHVPCGSTPPFAASSEALWTDTFVYAYFAVIEFNIDPTIGGADAPGSGIFLHAWENGPTHGCVALPLQDLVDVLRWLEPADHPVIEIGTSAQVGHLPPGA
jgi:L,D-peptidoglycan transpeptidase YkuD (ErfK/YbiS/YcfS/YnhG family)